MVRCSVLGCKSDSRTKMPGLSFHSDRCMQSVAFDVFYYVEKNKKEYFTAPLFTLYGAPGSRGVHFGIPWSKITPISPRWRDAIEKRIQEERFLTFEAIKRGARVHPGQFWDLPGTFLFTVYVMTALGFGAPVPHTIWGRSCALIYAVLAVPMHIYLMVNSSTCIVRNVSAHNCSLRKQMKSRSILEEGMLRDNAKESPNCSRNSEMIKTSNYGAFRRKIKRIITVFCACRCVPLATVMYYTCGAIAFGVLRDRPAVDVVMFPIEFTTTGGLERINGHVRFLYGFYVEGAMVLIACILATLRRRSNNKVNLIADKYRLFKVDN